MSRPARPSDPPARPSEHVLALNTGSSSFKYGLYRMAAGAPEALLTGQADSLEDLVARLAASELRAVDAVGHRVVHCGPVLREHCRIDDAVLRELEAAVPFAPLHMPATLALIALAGRQFPAVPQVACFDTRFHAGLPDIARVLPVAKTLRTEGVRRYGFHGLSCESVMARLGPVPPRRVVIAHLGHGASVTAVRDGGSVDTSMGLTPTGGLIMGTRSGDLDPGLLMFLLREKHLDAAALEQLVDHHSGLLGISGLGSDMRQLRQAEATNADARLAIRMFCASVAKQLAAMVPVLDGVDLIVFTGGIGENDALSRAEICRGLGWLGVRLDEARNRAHADTISSDDSRCAVRVLASQEDEQIARHTRALASG